MYKANVKEITPVFISRNQGYLILCNVIAIIFGLLRLSFHAFQQLFFMEFKVFASFLH